MADSECKMAMKQKMMKMMGKGKIKPSSNPKKPGYSGK